jgi:hypothetical protein
MEGDMDLAPLDQWDKYESGLLVMWPLLAGGAVPVASGSVVLRLEYAENADHAAAIVSGQTPPSSLQLGLTLEQIDETIRVLGNAAEKIRASMSQGGKLN